MDAGGGEPFGQDFGVGAEFVADGGVEVGDEVAGLFDPGADEGGFTGVFCAVVGLLGFFAGDGFDVVREVGDKGGGHGVGDVEGTGMCHGATAE